MNDQPKTERFVTDWLRAAAPLQAPERLLTAALDRVAVIGQERRFGGRPLDASIQATTRLRWALVLMVLVALVAAIVGAGGLLPRESAVLPPAPGNGWIAYSQHHRQANPDVRNGAMELVLVREGSQPQTIAGADGADAAAVERDVCPAFSPDGTQLAYAESTQPTEVDNVDVWGSRAVMVVTVGAAGRTGTPAIRMPVPGTGDDPCPAWTPDGKALVFVTDAETGSLAMASLSSPTKLAPIQGTEPVHDFTEFAVSPAGPTIAIGGPSGIWLLPLGGGTPSRLANDAFTGVAWSPEGTRIAASLGRDASATSVAVVGLDGARGSLGSGSDPVWSPDGRRIAFERWIGAGTPDAAAFVVVAGPDGSATHLIALASLPEVGSGPIYLSSGIVWSPDGSRLVFASGPDLVSISPTGDPAPQVLATSALGIGQTGMSWQRLPSSTPTLTPAPIASSPGAASIGVPLASGAVSNGWIAYSTDSRLPGGTDGRTGSDIYLVREGAGPPVLVAGRAGGTIRNVCPAFSPDGSRLAFGTTSDQGRDIVVLGVDQNGVHGDPLRLAVAGPGPAVCVRWSADGTRVGYVEDGAVVIRGLDGSSPGIVAGDPTIADLQPTGEPTWSDARRSPGGEWTAHLQARDPGADLIISTPDGTVVRRIALGYAPYAIAAWSPDSRQVLLMQDVGGFTMHAVSVDGSLDSRVVSNVATNGARSWPSWGDVSWQPVYP